MFGQAYGAFKLVQKFTKVAARALGANEKDANNIGSYVGAYAGYFTGLITADPAGMAATAVDIADQIQKNSDDKTPKP